MDTIDSRESSLLEHSSSAIRVTQLIPTDGRHLVSLVRPDRHGMVDHERLHTSTIAICQAIHQPVTERVELLGRRRLRNAGASSATWYVEGGDRDVGRAINSRVC